MPSGYRLLHFELYNWGTFHGEVYAVEPKGHTALLTGANGSGKTTLVDGLLTLLVPPQKRFYNQSSGAESRRERNEESYVLGHFGRSADEQDGRSRVNKLRPDKTSASSVLLACFLEPRRNQYITLAQVRYFQNQQLKTVYIVSTEALRIAEHFTPLDAGGQWKKRLKAQFHREEGEETPAIQFYDAFSRYARAFVRLTGMRSEKALSLFNQTVGIKVLGNLNDFIRRQMLEEPEAEEQFRRLRRHYDDLMGAHRMLRKTEKQIEWLQPIVQQWESLEEAAQSLDHLQQAQQLIPPYYARLWSQLGQRRLEALDHEKKKLAEHLHQQESHQKQLDDEAQQIRWTLQNKSTGQQLHLLHREAEQWEETLKIRQEERKHYLSCLEAFDGTTELDLDQFYRNQENAVARKRSVQEELSQLGSHRAENDQQLRDRQDRLQSLQKQLQSLQDRRSNIPDALLRVRDAMLEDLEVEEEQLPFAGELMRVLPGEEAWQPAIEKLLRPLGTTLLVPEHLYREVSTYVNKTHLGVRLVYQKIKSETISRAWYPDPQYVPGKLELREDTAYYSWLAATLERRYLYRCTDTLDDFRRSDRAITQEGQIKSQNRHEKDDRGGRRSRDYVLGWSTQDKAEDLRQEMQELRHEMEALSNKAQDLVTRYEKLDAQRDLLAAFTSRFRQYEAINTEQAEQKLIDLQRQIEQLQAADVDGNTLQDQLKGLEQQIQQARQERDRLIKRQHGLEQEHQRLVQRLKQSRQLLELYAHVDLDQKWAVLLPFIPHYIEEDALDNLEARQQEVSEIVREKQQEREAQIQQLRTQLTRKMSVFCHPGRDILDQFPDWVTDVQHLHADPQYGRSFKELYDRLVHEELEKHRRRFKQYMEQAVFTALQSFRNELEAQERQILDHLDALNRSLYDIRFSQQPATYIQVNSRPSTHAQVQEFKDQLRACLPDLDDVASDPEVSEEHFQRIQALFQRLSEDENWRRIVTDVRNWLSFSAQEYHREDDSPGKIYESTGELSGGEKAQLTYTILSAALAFQFGLQSEKGAPQSQNGFRFIVVDEAFSKLDPEKSRYLMDLCKQLDFQLLVVTPLDKVHVVEDYIRHCHYVENKYKRNSVVYNLTIEAYHEAKSRWQRGQA